MIPGFDKCDTCDHANKSGDKINSVKGVMYGCDRSLKFPCGHYELSKTIKASIFIKKIKVLFPASPEGYLWFNVFSSAAKDSTGKNSTYENTISALRFLRQGIPENNLLGIDPEYIRDTYKKCGLKL